MPFRTLALPLLLSLLTALACSDDGSSSSAAGSDMDTSAEPEAVTPTDATNTADAGPTIPVEWAPPVHQAQNPVAFDPAGLPEDLDVFPCGAMSGDPRPGSVYLWTRVIGDASVRARVWVPEIDPDDPDQIDLLADIAVTPGEEGLVHQRVDGLLPGLSHEAAFFVVDEAGAPTARGPILRFTAPPPEDAHVRLTFSGTHGTHQEFAPFPTLVTNAAHEPFALYVHMGDAVYADAAHTRDEYRAFWDETWRTEGFRAVLPQALYLPVWDDHEVVNNYDAETVDAARIRAGQDAFFDYNAFERDPDHPERYWRSWRWGRTAELIALDTRSDRLYSTRNTAEATYLGAAQMAWLKERLSTSDAVFKLVLTSVPITYMAPMWDGAKDDRWDGYLAQREELLAFIADQGVEDVYFLTGDFHMAFVGRVDPPGGVGEGLFEAILGPGAQENALGDRQKIIDTLGEEFDPLPPDQFLWGYPFPNLTYVDLDPFTTPPTFTVRYHDPETGDELYRAMLAGGQVIESEF